MLHLLKIDLKKLVNYRTFWIICGLYFLTLGTTTASGMEFLKWLASLGMKFGTEININRIPLYHFPDIWLNLLWFSGLLKIMLAIMVVISITNEFTYRTIRQNIIDGLSRWEFLQSKIMTNVLLSLMSMAMVFVIILVTGIIYTPDVTLDKVLIDMEFLPAYFLEVFFFLSYALMLGILIRRSGLTIILLMTTQMIEGIIKANVDDYIPAIIPYFPMQSIWELVNFPYHRYAFQEIKDFVSPLSVALVLGWTFLFNYFSYLKLKKSDI